MRAWLNAILSFIGTTSLTDEEYTALNVTGVTPDVHNQAAYDLLAEGLQAREPVSSLQDRLVGVFKAKGFTVSPNSTANTNIYIGSVLE